LKFTITQALSGVAKEKEGVKLPEKFTQKTSFCVYEEVMDTYLNTQMGCSGIPLNYIICKEDEPDEDVEYDNDAEMAAAIAPHKLLRLIIAGFMQLSSLLSLRVPHGHILCQQ